MMRRKTVLHILGSTIIGAAVICMICFAVISLRGVEAARASEELRFAEEAIRRAAVTCYCIEGRFPENYAYLRDNYGLLVDEERFAVHYSVFAQNIMPDITVVKR